MRRISIKEFGVFFVGKSELIRQRLKLKRGAMRQFANLFQDGNSQAIRLPREFCFKGNRVRIRREGRNVVLEPVLDDPEEWLAELKSIPADPEFMKDRKQPMIP